MLICVVAVPVCLAEAARSEGKPKHPTVSELLDKYTLALDSTQSFISTWEYSGIGSCNIPSWGMRKKNAKTFSEGEHRTDNKGRSYARTYRWGDVSGSIVSKENGRYRLRIIGDGFAYHHNRPLGQTKYRGDLDYRKKGTPGWDDPSVKTWGYFERNGSNNLLLGYVQTKARLDNILKNARRISVRPKPEMIGGSACYVIHAETEYGDFRVWLDSGHGYHPAKIQAFVGVGDDIGDPGSPHIITRKEGTTRKYTLENVRFKKMDGVWTPMEADRKHHIILGSPEKFSSERSHFRRKTIVLNPDHDALGSFADPMKNPELDPEMRDGTRVNLNLRDGMKYQWLNGKPVVETNDN